MTERLRAWSHWFTREFEIKTDRAILVPIASSAVLALLLLAADYAAGGWGAIAFVLVYAVFVGCTLEMSAASLNLVALGMAVGARSVSVSPLMMIQAAAIGATIALGGLAAVIALVIGVLFLLMVAVMIGVILLQLAVLVLTLLLAAWPLTLLGIVAYFATSRHRG